MKEALEWIGQQDPASLGIGVIVALILFVAYVFFWMYVTKFSISIFSDASDAQADLAKQYREEADRYKHDADKYAKRSRLLSYLSHDWQRLVDLMIDWIRERDPKQADWFDDRRRDIARKEIDKDVEH